MQPPTSTIMAFKIRCGYVILSNILSMFNFTRWFKDCSLNQGIWEYLKTLTVSTSHSGQNVLVQSKRLNQQRTFISTCFILSYSIFKVRKRYPDSVDYSKQLKMSLT